MSQFGGVPENGTVQFFCSGQLAGTLEFRFEFGRLEAVLVHGLEVCLFRGLSEGALAEIPRKLGLVLSLLWGSLHSLFPMEVRGQVVQGNALVLINHCRLLAGVEDSPGVVWNRLGGELLAVKSRRVAPNAALRNDRGGL